MRELPRAGVLLIFVCILQRGCVMVDIKDVEGIVEDYLSGKPGYYLLSASVKGDNLVTVIVDHDETPVDFDTIVDLTRYLEERMDREREDFELEVSSAGLTSPLESPRRYRKFLGKSLEVVLKSGQKEEGTLLEVDEEGFRLEVVRMVKPEGARRKRPTPEVLDLKYEEVKKATYQIDF